MQMPTGRMAPEGEFNLATMYNSEYQHFSASVQLFSWLETTARYTQVQDLLYSDDPLSVVILNTRIKALILKPVYLKKVHGFQKPQLGLET